MTWTEAIESYQPYNDQEQKDQAFIVNCLRRFEDVLTRNNGIAHLTSSAWTVNLSRNKALMVYHNIYRSWSWTGGHADGDQDLLAVAIREVREETGINRVCPVIPDIFALDVLPVAGHIKNGIYIPAHLHLSVAYWMEADESQPLSIKTDENSGVRWMAIDELNTYVNEPQMQKVYDKLIAKMKLLKLE